MSTLIKDQVFASDTELKAILPAKHVVRHCTDAMFWLPDLKWIERRKRDFERQLWKWRIPFHYELGRMGIPRWTRKFQCEDFADTYRLICRVEFKGYDAAAFADAESPAVGNIAYRTQCGGAHMINFAVLNDRSIVYIDNTARITTLTEGEVNSIFFIYL